MSAAPGVRVLHLEDDALDAELIHERFHAREPGRWRFEHVAAREPFEAALGRGPYDLVIMDHNIPGYDGMLALLEAHRRLPQTPIIILSGSLTEEDAVECLKAGATDYVLKSRMQRLAAAAERALEEARTRRERERVENDLRDLANRFEELARQSPDVFWFATVDPEKVVYVSPAVERLWGRPALEFYADNRAWAAVIHPEDRARVEEAFGRWLVGDEDRFDQEFRIVRPDGSVRWIHDTGTRTLDAGGRPVRVSGVARDITAQREAEQRARALNAELQRRVEDRTTELRLANRDLDAFSFLVSHDLRAPLRAVNGFTALLKEECGPALGDTGGHYIERIETGCRRLERLIEDILGLAQVSRAEMMPGDVPLSSLVEEAVSTLRARDPEREVEAKVQPGLRAHADLRLMRSILAELVGNAWKFSSGRRPARIEFGLERGTGLLETFFVRDNGAGFDPRLSEKLFTPFQRLHAEEEFPGAGMGLARARRAIERHGGNVWASGRPGEGATFYFSLPKGPRAS